MFLFTQARLNFKKKLTVLNSRFAVDEIWCALY